MRNVKRRRIPSVLQRKARQWTRELLAELRRGTNADKKRLKTLKQRYNHEEIRTALRKMYKFCCYCESRILHITVDHIEHRKPQSTFPKETFAWENLHLACPNCNKAKSDHWDRRKPILDAVKDVPITKYLSYERYYRSPIHPRGETTRDHADLDREELLDARKEIFWVAIDMIESANNKSNSASVDVVRGKLNELSVGRYGSFVKYLQRTFMK